MPLRGMVTGVGNMMTLVANGLMVVVAVVRCHHRHIASGHCTGDGDRVEVTLPGKKRSMT